MGDFPLRDLDDLGMVVSQDHHLVHSFEELPEVGEGVLAHQNHVLVRLVFLQEVVLVLLCGEDKVYGGRGRTRSDIELT